MTRLTDCRPVAAELYFLPVTYRTPLKFGTSVSNSIVCARVRITVEDRTGRRADGWGETPLSAGWAWPSELAYSQRCQRMQDFCQTVTGRWIELSRWGHSLEIGHDFQEAYLPGLLADCNRGQTEPMPLLAALICTSPLDLATHDAYGMLHRCDTYATYGAEMMNRDLASFLRSAADVNFRFNGVYPDSFLARPGERTLLAWHLVGGLDPLEAQDVTEEHPRDQYPITLVDWIAVDGLKCLKIKLRGNDSQWDYERLKRIGEIAAEREVQALCADFNCMVHDPEYVNEILDRLAMDEPDTFARLLYVEQPFPYDLDANPIDVRSVARRKPLFLDESASDWQSIRRGRELGWTDVALKTCKTQTTAILSLCWAKSHAMRVMVQDLTNPMLAQIAHVRLAAHAGTILGVETNSMQFHPEASKREELVHPGIYRRRRGRLDLASIGATGFGYRVADIDRVLPRPSFSNSVVSEPIETVEGPSMEGSL